MFGWALKADWKHGRAGAILLVVMVTGLVAATSAQAQQFLNQRAVGGVLVDPSGMLSKAGLSDLQEIRKVLSEASSVIPPGMRARAEMRKVSLARLGQAIREAATSGKDLPAEVQCLAGLQTIHYVIADPETKDIFLVGIGEGWKPGPNGSLIGLESGEAIMLLDDLVVALRATHTPQPQVISCSIDPSAEALRRLRAFANRVPRGANPQAIAQDLERILGPQQITITGVPSESHFARVLVTSDYRLKRLGLALDPSPVPNLPGFMEFMGPRVNSTLMPRWWLAPAAGNLSRDPEGLIWELPEVRVQAFTENDYLNSRGEKVTGGVADPAAQKWANLVTERYGQLSRAEPVFAQLQNCMELAVVAALLAQERLAERVGLDLSPFLDTQLFTPVSFTPPSKVASQSFVVRKGDTSLVACGGVEINPWKIVSRVEQKDELSRVRSVATISDANTWWSN